MAMKEIISGGRRGATIVVVEPAMDETQPPMKELERFQLQPGEEREYEMPTPTAGYRVISGGEPTPAADPSIELNPEPTPNQEPKDGFAPGVQEEISAGQERRSEIESAEKKAQKEPDPNKKGSLPKTKEENAEKDSGEAQVSSAGTPQDNVPPDAKRSTPTTNTEDTSGSPKRPGRPRKMP
jgi:hypothetical protein